jgi:hypothetical protein
MVGLVLQRGKVNEGSIYTLQFSWRQSVALQASAFQPVACICCVPGDQEERRSYDDMIAERWGENVGCLRFPFLTDRGLALKIPGD